MRFVEKTPGEILDYGWDWLKWLGSDTVQTSTWIVDAGLTVVSQNNDANSAAAFMGGGQIGRRYTAINRITTVGGRTAERTVLIKVVEHKYA